MDRYFVLVNQITRQLKHNPLAVFSTLPNIHFLEIQGGNVSVPDRIVLSVINILIHIYCTVYKVMSCIIYVRPITHLFYFFFITSSKKCFENNKFYNIW